MDSISWDKFLALPAAILVLILILYFVYRLLPSWKEIKLAEIKVREVEATSRSNEAGSFGKLSEALDTFSGLMENLFNEQQRNTKNSHIMQRVNADANDKILQKLDTLDELAAGHIAITSQIREVQQQVDEVKSVAKNNQTRIGSLEDHDASKANKQI